MFEIIVNNDNNNNNVNVNENGEDSSEPTAYINSNIIKEIRFSISTNVNDTSRDNENG
jgi:hypothetical protein